MVLTLCGVLKDILLVGASILIWGTHISLLQTLGYSIALGGLVYYKLGADILRDRYTRLRTDGSLAWQKFGNDYPVLRKVTATIATVLLVFLGLVALYGRDDNSGGDVEARLPDSLTVPPGAIPVSTPDLSYTPARRLDIVITMDAEIPSKVGFGLRQIKGITAFTGLDPHIVIYFRDPKSDMLYIQQQTNAAAVRKLGPTGGDDDTYLSHIVEQWDDLAEHTLFLNGGFKNLPEVEARIEDYFRPSTGVLSLGSEYRSYPCGLYKDPWGSKGGLSRIPEIFAVVYSEICPTSHILLSNSGQSIVSAKRIRGTPKHVYEHLRTLLESDKEHWIHREAKGTDEPNHPSFGRVLEKSWMIAFKCADPKLAESCPTLTRRRGAEDSDGTCQCTD